MKKIKAFIKKTVKFITEDIWSKSENEYRSRTMRIFARQAKVFIFTARSYGQDQLGIRSAALTYFTLMSLVPLAAIIFGLTKGFKFEMAMIDYLYGKFPQYSGLVDQIVSFANALLEKTKGGLMAIIGFLFLMWAVINVFLNIESSFNHIWEVRHSRSFTRKVSDYLSVLMVAPIFWLVSNDAREVIGTAIDNFVEGTIFTYVVDAFAFIMPFLVIWIMFSVLYFVMPNTRVKFSAAFRAAVISGTAFTGFQMFYFYSQSMLSSYNAIYGSFAALPLFLIWLNISWQIILFGAELSFGYQNIDKYEYERISNQINFDFRRRITITILHRIVYNFSVGAPLLDSSEISQILNIPIRVVRDVIYDLEMAGFVVAVSEKDRRTNKYIPARDLSELRIFDVISAMEHLGLSNFRMKEGEDMKKVTAIMNCIENSIETSPNNILLMDVNKDLICGGAQSS